MAFTGARVHPKELKLFLVEYMTNGRNRTRAYRDALGKHHWQPQSLWVGASRLFNSQPCQKMFKKMLDNQIATKEEVLSILSKHLRDPNPDVSLKAGKLMGDYHKLFTQKLEVATPEKYKEIIAGLQELQTSQTDQLSLNGNGSSELDINLTPSSGSSTNPEPVLKLSSEDQG